MLSREMFGSDVLTVREGVNGAEDGGWAEIVRRRVRR
jgi:hypothetical protein